MEGLHGGLELIEHGVVGVGADDGAAGAGEFGTGTAGAGGFDHFDIAGADLVESAAEIEVFVEEGADLFALSGDEHIAHALGEVGPLVHGGDDIALTAFPAAADVIVEDFGAFAEAGGVGDVDVGKGSGVEFLVDAVAAFFDGGAVEVHEDDTFEGLDDAILQASGDAEFVVFDAEDEGGQEVGRDFDLIELHEGAPAGGDDGAGAGHADLRGDIAGVTESEIATVEGNFFADAIVVEAFDGGFQKTDAAIVAELADIAGEGVDAREDGVVAFGGLDGEFGAFEKGDFRPVVADDEGDGFTKVTVRGIADETGASVGFGGDEHGKRKKSWKKPMKRKQAGMILDGKRLTTSKEEGKVGCLQVGRIWASWDDDE